MIGTIYKIEYLLNVNYVYVGSSINFRQRMSQHRTDSRRGDTKLYRFINEHGGFANFRTVRIEEFNFEETNELRGSNIIKLY